MTRLLLPLFLFLASCTSGSISLAWAPLYDLPLAYDPDQGLWRAPVPGGCSPELRVTAACEAIGDLPEDALSWRVAFEDAALEVPPCDVGVEAPESAGPCTATIWGPVEDDTGI